mgnify:CR=1 FL=1|jgi:alpha-D-ribose 1-methylphosphonate 5-triphosphate synthase subunit PhnI
MRWVGDSNLLLVESVEAADIVSALKLLHVVDFGSGDLALVLNWALADLLINDDLVD